MKNEKRFSYPRWIRYANYLVSILMIIVFFLVLVDFFLQGFEYIQGKVLSYWVTFFIMFLTFIAGGTSYMCYWQELSVSEEGINFQVFYLWWKFVPWSQIRYLKHSKFLWSIDYLIITEKLTIFHRLTGIFHGTVSPAFIFNRYLSNYQEAIEVIQTNLNSTTKVQ